MEIGTMGGLAGLAWEYKEGLVVGSYVLGGALLAHKSFPRWGLGLREQGRREGNYGGLGATFVVPYAHASFAPSRVVTALESLDADAFDGAHLGFVVGRKTNCFVAGRNVEAPLRAIAAEYGNDASFEPVEDLAEVLADGPERHEKAGLVPVYARYELAGAAEEGLGTSPLSVFGQSDPLDGPLTRIAHAVDHKEGERAMVQLFLRPATRGATEALKAQAAGHMQHADVPERVGPLVKAWETLVMQFGTERGRDKVGRRDRKRAERRAAAKEKEPKETEASRYVKGRVEARRKFDVSFCALGWVAPGKEEALKEAFDAYFDRFSKEGIGEIREVARGGSGLPARTSVAELRVPPPARSARERHPVMTPQEVGAIWHPLGERSTVPNRNVASLVTLAPPPEMPEDGVCLGVSNHGGSRGTPLYFAPEMLDKHGDITGKTGKGKSSLQLELIRGALAWPYVHDPNADDGEAAGMLGGPAWTLARRAAKRLRDAGAGAAEAVLRKILAEEKMGFMLFDPKGGELFTKAISCLPAWRRADLTVLDPGDEEHPVARINFFDPCDHMEPDEQAAIIVAALEQRFPSGFGANMRPIFVHAALACIAANKKLKEAGLEPRYGLLHLTETGFLSPRLDLPEGDYEQPPLRREVLEHLRGDPDWKDVVAYWDAKDANNKGATQSKDWNPITNKIAHFKNRKLARFIGGGRSDIDFMKTLEEGRILLFNLSQGSLPADTHELVGTLVLNLLCRTSIIRHDRAVRRGDAENLRRFLVVIDEAQNFACPEMTKVLTEGRSQRTPLWIGHQYVDQFEDKKLMGALANVGTRVLFGTTPEDAKKAAVFVPEDRFTPPAIERIPEHNFVVVNDKLGVVTGSTLKMPLTDNAYVKDLREGSARGLAEVASPGSVAALEATLLMGTADEPAENRVVPEAEPAEGARAVEEVPPPRGPRLRDPRPVDSGGGDGGEGRAHERRADEGGETPGESPPAFSADGDDDMPRTKKNVRRRPTK